MLNQNNEQRYYEAIEHFIGKPVRFIKQDFERDGVYIVLENSEIYWLSRGDTIDNMQLVPKKDVAHNRICISCGEQHGYGYKDKFGRCTTTVNKFWGKARKLYWHRYLKK